MKNPFTAENRQQRLQSADQIESVLKITSVPTFLIAATVLLLLMAFVTWGFLGTVIQVVSIAYPNETHEAKISTVSPVVEKNGMVHLEALLTPHPHLMPGMTAIVTLAKK